MKGLIHIYCGDGKGKTSAALGLAVRAAGRGLKVQVVRFLKNDQSGEVAALVKIPGIRVTSCERSFGFSWNMNQEQKAEAAAYYTELFEKAWKMGGEQDVLVLDELCGAVDLGFVPEELVLAAIGRKPEHLEVVLTGRNPSRRLLELADYVTEMKMIRHPYENGIQARAGIEY